MRGLQYPLQANRSVRIRFPVGLSCFLLAGCAPQPGVTERPIREHVVVQTPPPAGVPAANRHGFGSPSKLVSTTGRGIGTVSVAPWPSSVAIGISASGLPPGTYRMYVHEVGRCEPPDFRSAGARWSRVASDLGPATVQSDGRLYLSTLLNGARPRSSDTGNLPVLLDEDGASLVIAWTGPPSPSPAAACAVLR